MIQLKRAPRERTPTIRVISWNVHNRNNSEDQLSALLRLKPQPQVIALQELNCNAWPEMQKTLRDHQFACVRKGELLVATCLGRIEEAPRPSRAVRPKCLLSVLIHHPVAGKIEVHNTHIPNGSKNDELKITTLDAVYKMLASSCAHHRILCGDFNTPQKESARGKIRLFTWGQRLPEGGFKSNWGQRWDKSERNILEGLARFDLKDVFRKQHGYSVRASSWRKYRIDHIFASESLRPVSCRYLQRVRRKMRGKRLSDHAAIEAFFHPRNRFF